MNGSLQDVPYAVIASSEVDAAPMSDASRTTT
jgi:hypothetical protein